MEMQLAEWVLWMYANHRGKFEKIMYEKCPKCGKAMVRLGFSGERFGLKIAIWHACDDCKVITKTIEDDGTPKPFGGRNLKEYEFL